MEIIEVTAEKKKYLSLLLLADEQEDMIDPVSYTHLDVYKRQDSGSGKKSGI